MDKRIIKFTPTDLGLEKLECCFINDNSTEKINYLSRCQSVKYFNLIYYTICSSENNNLLELTKLCPKLRRINLNYSHIELTDDHWD